MNNELLLLSGNDIPIAKANLLLHQPTIKEIAYVGEEIFFSGCEFLRFSKNNLSIEDKSHLENAFCDSSFESSGSFKPIKASEQVTIGANFLLFFECVILG